MNRSARGRGGHTGVGRRPQQLGERPMGFIGVRRLEDWATLKDSPSELLVRMMSNLPELTEFLNSNEITDQWMRLLMTSLGAVLNAKVHMKNTSKLLEVLATTKFYTHHMLRFLKQSALPQWKNFAEIVLHLIRETAVQIPALTSSCREILVFIYNKRLNLGQDMALLNAAIGAFNSRTETEQKKRKRRLRKWKDTDEPPDDIGDLSIFPTRQDLDTSIEPFLRANQVTKAFRDKHHYLDVHFRLLREDFIQPLREGLAIYRDGVDTSNGGSDMKFYTNVRIVGMNVFNGIEHILRLDIENLQQVRWDTERRLIYGSLICLSNDKFQTIIYATITQIKREELKKMGILRVKFENCFDDVFSFSSEDNLTMTENPSYFEAYRHVLEGLQEADKSILSMETYLVKCQKSVAKPKYLTNSDSFNLSCLAKTQGHSRFRYPALQPQTWPGLSKLCLNKHQFDAVATSLTKELSLIQGPPGTGKTYVGLKIMRLLLENAEVRCFGGMKEAGPILVVCYTNHALDQFLEEMLPFCPDGIVRVGGRSTSDVLKKFNIKELRMKKQDSLSTRNCIKDVHREMDKYGHKIVKLAHQMQMAHLVIQNEALLTPHMNDVHSLSMQRGSMTKNAMTEWLHSKNVDFENHLRDAVETHAIALVMKGTKFCEDVRLDFRRKIPTIMKVLAYRYWISKVSDRTKLAAQKEILPDSILERYVTVHVWQNIHRNHSTVEEWLIGSNVVDMLDAIEAIQTGGSEIENKVFDNTDEYKRLQEQRIFGDESDSDDGKVRTSPRPRKTFELSSISNLRRAKSLGVDLTFNARTTEEGGWQTKQKTLSLGKVIKLLNSSKPFSKESEAKILDVWQLPLPQRYQLYKLWLTRYLDNQRADIRHLVEKYNEALERKQEVRSLQTVNILSQAKVIGMTTTGAAKHRQVLKAVGPQIVVVEEAAEVLEAHIVTALSQDCQHLILIGDHQQLRPKTEVHELAKQFGLEISLFERFINNGMNRVQLTEQHRMRPEISRFMRHIYPSLEDSEAVHGRSDVRGMTHDIFFIKHNEPENVVKNSKSKLNEFEARYIIQLCCYLLAQGYENSEITVLGTYGGQVALIKEYMSESNNKKLQDIRVSTVDSFQGEQNKIILLSLVRSNSGENVGFLSTDNRVCVALSRAQYGMYVIGDLDLLSRHSQLWQKIHATATQHRCVGKVLQVQCRQHKRITNIRTISDFDKLKTGGCGQACNAVRSCGHKCKYLCHAVDHENIPNCDQPCERQRPCGHICRKKCHVRSHATIPCKESCDAILSCGHDCQRPCHGGDHSKLKCSQPCDLDLQCGHPCPKKCHEWNDHRTVKCLKPCDAKLACGHPCPYRCHGKSHAGLQCSQPCEKTCLAGHHCRGKCDQPCPPCQERKLFSAKFPCGHKEKVFCDKKRSELFCAVCRLDRRMKRLRISSRGSASNCD